ncbi:MAG: DUF3472 domain-containing protein [Planctomycetota bacterium]
MRVTCVLASWLTAFALAEESSAQPAAGHALRIPAFSGYAHPDPQAVRRDVETGAVHECRGELRYYVEITTPGEVKVRLVRRPGACSSIELRCAHHPGDGFAALVAHPLEHTTDVDMGSFGMHRPGMLRLTLRMEDGSPLRGIVALLVSGAAAAGAKALTVERRNASSVHLAYDVPAAHEDDIEWFACECEPTTDPLWTFYMATGWHRGYFGMQVNSPSERRLIFSVWDSGNEAIDRERVAAADLVHLVRKGDGVVAEAFGHEGTGGHSHLVCEWQLGDRVRFLVHAEPDGTHTTYTGWYQHVRQGKALGGEAWQLLASFRAPKDGKFLRRPYSFSENFSGANGDRLRDCEFGPVWLRSHGGEWLPVRTATFTHDSHGKQWRFDRAGGVRGQRFFLRHGDYRTAGVRYGTRLDLPAAQGPAAPPPMLPQ